MQVSISWLKEYIEIKESPVELAERLTMAGLEVESIRPERYGYEKSFVGRVLTAKQHPERPDFQVLSMDCGAFRVQVLSNLREFREGEILPIACRGFALPDGTLLDARRVTGVESEGKIVSEADVEHSDNDGVILPLPREAKPGDILPDLLGYTDMILKFDLTANRADCLSVFGICRELSAILNRRLKKTPFDFKLDTAPRDVEFSVDIRDKKLCPRYSGRVLQDIRIAKSPVWLKRRLISGGMRPINGIVDVTNFVMLETGQPLHAFDLDTLADRAIVVRRAARGETIVTIDGATRQLTTDMLVIADSRKPVAVAGVMGGADTEVSGNTRNLLLESAHFNQRSIRRTSMGLGLRTEASIRFEKGVDPTRAADASDYASFLIQKLGWGRALDGMIDECPLPYKPKIIPVSCNKVRGFLGEPAMTNKFIADVMRRLDFPIEPGASDASFKVTVPGHRFDMGMWQDVAEEAARIFGYQNIRSELPDMKVHRATVTPNVAFRRELKDKLVACGLSECVTFSFTSMQELKGVWMEDNLQAVPLLNPLTEEHTHLRPTIIPNMLRTIARNLARGNPNLGLFELGKIFIGPGEPVEKESLVIGLCGNMWHVPAASMVQMNMDQYYVIKGIIEDFLGRAGNAPLSFKKSSMSLFHPHHSATVFMGGARVGEFGEVHPQVCRNFGIRAGVALAELDPEVIRSARPAARKYKKFSRFPESKRDLSVVVDESVEAGQIMDILVKRGGDILNRADMVDVFRSADVGVGKKSVTFSLSFRHMERTLSDEEINGKMERILGAIKEKLGGELR